ncbi:MAG: hypothetical protein DLM61_26670 [Pseudonocardiales bacterium]|nr:helix-turn-helix domain-containing protein [Pseudonocardiales bacterium]PZS22063.1 MAG: hypothetical protein DLM61_26670 [Pseudonocardiales bacterium]
MGGRPGGHDELSRALRELRQAAHLSTRVAAERTGFSAAKISRVERGINVPTEIDVAALVHAYQAPPEVRTHQHRPRYPGRAPPRGDGPRQRPSLSVPGTVDPHRSHHRAPDHLHPYRGARAAANRGLHACTGGLP